MLALVVLVLAPAAGSWAEREMVLECWASRGLQTEQGCFRCWSRRLALGSALSRQSEWQRLHRAEPSGCSPARCLASKWE